MSHFICNFVPHLKYSITIHSKFHRLFCVQPVSQNPNLDSFTVNYFINKCGFSLKKAVLASKYVKFEKLDKHDVCLSFLKKHGFSETQLLKLLRRYPRVLDCDPEKTLLPKIEFLKSKGFVEREIPALLVIEPSIFVRSSERHLVASFNLLNDHLGSVGSTVKAIKLCPRILPRFQDCVLPNIKLLEKAGVTNRSIAFGLNYKPHIFAGSCDKFQELVENIKKLGIEPGSLKFIKGICVGSFSKSAWKNRLEVYRRWDCSEEEVISVFKYDPWSMRISKEKLDQVMNFFVNEMGWTPQMLLLRPQLLSSSLERRIVPRCSVYKVLLSKGLLKKKPSMHTVIKYSDDEFLAKFVNCYPEEAPELLRLYKEKMKLNVFKDD